MSHGDPSIRVATLLDQLRERVAEKRASGEYPAELEQRLAEHFARVSYHRVETLGVDPLIRAVRALDPGQIDPALIPVPTRERAATQRAHELVARAVRSQIEGVTAQSRGFADRTEAALRAATAVLEEQVVVQRDLLAQLDMLLHRVGRLESAAAGDTADLADRVTRLEREWTAAPWWDDDRLADQMEGTRAETTGRLRPLAEWMGARVSGPVLVLRAGRGELVELLAAAGLDARGHDPRPGHAGVHRSGDVEALVTCDDGSLGAVVLAGRAERVPVAALADVVQMAAVKLAPGGLLIIDLADAAASGPPSPGPLPYHPLDLRYLTFLCREAGLGMDGDGAPAGPRRTVVVGRR